MASDTDLKTNTARQILQLLNEMELIDSEGELILLDSLTLVGLVSQLETLFSISIPLPTAFKTFNSKQAVIDLIMAILKQHDKHFNHLN